MKRKIFALAISVILTVGALSGCGKESGSSAGGNTESVGTADASGGADSQESDGQESGNQEVEKIVMYCMSMGAANEYTNIVDAVNAISVPEIGVEVELVILDIGQWFQQYSMLVSGSEKIDLMPSFMDAMPSAVNQGAFMELADLQEQYGKGIETYVPKKWMNAACINGSLYGIPSANVYGRSVLIEYNAEIVKNLNIDVSGVKSLEDWEPVMEQVKAAYPGVTPYVASGGTSMPNLYNYAWDPLGDTLGVIMLNEESGTTVQNLFATQEYAELCELMRSWSQKGYIASDASTETDNFDSLCKADKAFSTLTAGDMTLGDKASVTVGKEISTIELTAPWAYTSAVSAVWNIPSTSEHPEAAMKFLNLMFTNADVANLLAWGEEGVNYRKLEDGTIDFLDGEDGGTCAYHPNIEWLLPNQYITLPWSGSGVLTSEEAIAWNDSSKLSPAFGFTFDSSNVQNEITACNNAVAQYRVALELGAVDVDKALAEFQKALGNAGIDKIMEEKQAQLDAWLAEQ